MCASTVIPGTTLGAIRRIRSSGAATGPLARQRAPQPVTWTEAEAIRQAQVGNAAAFEFLYQLHGRRVYALCLRMVGNPADAEDLMQEAFLQLYRKIGTFRGESAFSTWLHRMTVNVVLMRLRKKSLPTDSLEETMEPDAENSGPKRDVGALDLRLSGAVDRVNLERSIESARKAAAEARHRHCCNHCARAERAVEDTVTDRTLVEVSAGNDRQQRPDA